MVKKKIWGDRGWYVQYLKENSFIIYLIPLFEYNFKYNKPSFVIPIQYVIFTEEPDGKKSAVT